MARARSARVPPRSYENDRLNTQVIAAPGSNEPCSATNPQGFNTAQTATGGAACTLGTVAGTTGVAPIQGSVANPASGNLYTGVNAKGQVISSGQAGTLFTPGELVAYPNGMEPQEGVREVDYQYNAGVKFKVLGFGIDANIGYGKDIDKIYTYQSANRSLFIDTHSTPFNFYDGQFQASQFTGTIDASRTFDVGLASPLTVAWGLEAREDTYDIGAGDPSSYYKEGPQSFPGFAPASAGAHSRKNYAGYVDFAASPIENLQVDVAGRFEHFTDFGDTEIGKVTARYDFTPEFAIRGTVSTGFRAPTLAEEFYTAVNVSPTSATVQLPANGAAAKLLGLENLKPEVSTQYSAGIVAHPLDSLTATVDVYSITLGDRIVTSSTVTSSGGSINTPLVTQAVAGRRRLARPDRDPAGRDVLPQWHQHQDTGRRRHRHLSVGFRRIWFGALDPGRQLQQHLDLVGCAGPGGAAGFQCQCQLLQPAVAVQLRAFRAAGKDRPDRGLDAG